MTKTKLYNQYCILVKEHIMLVKKLNSQITYLKDNMDELGELIELYKFDANN